MIKARCQNNDGKAYMLLGFSHENLNLLRQGKTIKFDGTNYGFDGDIVIFVGADEEELLDMLLKRAAVTPSTKLHLNGEE